MRFTPSALFASLLLTSSALALEYTTTLPYEDGNTLFISVGTNARGVATTATLSTITAGAAGATASVTESVTDGITVPTTSITSTTARTTARTTKKTTTTTGPDTTSSAQRVVGDSTSVAPMRTTTYWVNQPDGTWTDFTWTASVTAAPTVATANVPAGTILNYDSYQSSANSVVLAAAESSVASSAAGPRRALISDGAVGGWITLLLGAVGAGVGVLAL